jgi:hypothetical protein
MQRRNVLDRLDYGGGGEQIENSESRQSFKERRDVFIPQSVQLNINGIHQLSNCKKKLHYIIQFYIYMPI